MLTIATLGRYIPIDADRSSLNGTGDDGTVSTMIWSMLGDKGTLRVDTSTIGSGKYKGVEGAKRGESSCSGGNGGGSGGGGGGESVLDTPIKLVR